VVLLKLEHTGILILIDLIIIVRLLSELNRPKDKSVFSPLILFNSLRANDFSSENKAILVLLIVSMVVEKDDSLLAFHQYHFLPVVVFLIRVKVLYQFVVIWVVYSQSKPIKSILVVGSHFLNDQTLEVLEDSDSLHSSIHLPVTSVVVYSALLIKHSLLTIGAQIEIFVSIYK